ncbi:GNAT family N-acetyltransferase [Actinocorallia aurea]
MTVLLKPFGALSAAELDAWHALRAADPACDSPYFHPEFTAAVASSGADVHVALAHAASGNAALRNAALGNAALGKDTAGAVTAVLPVQRTGSVLRPVGWPAADFQGPVGGPMPPRALLRGPFRTFEFDHLATGLAEFEPYIESRRVSPFLDVTGGLDGYVGRAAKSGRDRMTQARRDLRRAERDHGPVRFTADDPDKDALDRLIDLKRAQYAATGAKDYFADPGHRELLHTLLATRSPGFAGLLTTLRAGDRLVAAHFGLRAGSVLHWWFPAYDREFARLSPGWMLLREAIAAAPALGVARIDLGRGEDDYKRRAKTGETVVCQGIATRDPLRLARRRALAALRGSPLAPGLRRLVRKVR